VIVKDVDECVYRGEDPQFLNHCLYPATCVNAVCGTGNFEPGAAAYNCVCEHEDFEEDGKMGCRRLNHTKTEVRLRCLLNEHIIRLFLMCFAFSRFFVLT